LIFWASVLVAVAVFIAPNAKGITSNNVGNILWSFHIWKPEIDATKLLTYNIPKPSTTTILGTLDVMPLALGAMNTATATSTEAQK